VLTIVGQALDLHTILEEGKTFTAQFWSDFEA
jgi:hypothetical protein